MALKPNAIKPADYGIAQNPVLGGEIEVWATLSPSLVNKSVRCLDTGVYEETLYQPATAGVITPLPVSATLPSGNKNVTVVGSRGLTGIVGTIIAWPLWASNVAKRPLVFPTGKAGEGNIPMPYAFGVRGEVLDEIQIPDYNPADDPAIWFNIGCTTERRMKLPTRMSKAIPCQMESSKFVVPGKTEIGDLSVTALNQGHEEGLLRISGMKTTVMLRVFKESVLEVARIYIIDWTPTIERTDPAAEAESTVQATGMFSKFAAISAEGGGV